MKHFFYLLAAAVFFTSCTQPFKRAKDGSQYKIVKASGGKKVLPGNYIELYRIVKYKDSLLGSTYEEGMPQYAPYDTAQFPPLFKEIFRDVNAGDSIVLKISVDSLMKNGQSAPFMKKGNFIVQSFKISNVFATKEQADSVARTHMTVAKAKAFKKASEEIQKQLGTTFAPQMKIDEKIITDYLNKKGTTASKTPWGTYVVVAVPGAGENLTEKNVAVVNYTGKTLQDSVFDSNIDPKFGHVEPLNVDMGQYTVIPGWIDGLKMLKKGSKATIVVPSSLAYGASGRPGIKANENLSFDVEVVDIITPEQNEAMQMAKQQAQMNMQQRMQQQMQEEAEKKKQHSGAGATEKK